VELDTCTKKRDHHWVSARAFELNGMSTSMHLNVLQLGSYNMLLGMDWLYLHMTKLGFSEKAIEWIKMEDKESYRVRRRLHQLKWL